MEEGAASATVPRPANGTPGGGKEVGPLAGDGYAGREVGR